MTESPVVFASNVAPLGPGPGGLAAFTPSLRWYE